jgi:hypothetical protein
MCRFPQKEISEISQITIIQDNSGIHIHHRPKYRISGNFRNFREISVVQDNNDIHINPKPRYRICGNFRNFREISANFREISGKFQRNFREISEISTYLIPRLRIDMYIIIMLYN